ncbi:MAG: transglutaminase domain-containing protein [Porphyromonadaceae bacterium]|nr:MAG: transglutaminase domain-containing protein [Porphyromonadaceae bacterium]
MKVLTPVTSVTPVTFFSLFTLLSFFSLFSSCTTKEFHVYSDPAYSQRVEARFNERKTLAAKRDTALFGVFNQNLTVAEQEGLKFLYAYMPLNDLADYNGDFYLNQVRWSLNARETFAWGKSIPEDLFRHFVLPYRVNNENLDTARIVFFRELKDRIKNMTMLNAALEVNHWCHEKVTYRGSDIRTSAPLASLRTAYGRCGEESTFAVTALRAVAIPARQVYTPRWAHSDDNHAWVEFWADGKWHYMGACEPECVPDLGWFTEPARRAMLIHTKVFGDYKGGERAENRETNYALINTLSTYAPTKEIHVQVRNAEGTPEKNASVEFQLYNYAEYYPISIKKTDENGSCSFVSGFGDLLVWAHTDNHFGFKKITVADIDTLKLITDQEPYDGLSMEFDMVPPVQREPFQIANDCRDQNNRMLQREDSIRGAYEKTFRTEEQARKFAASLNLDPDQIWNFISRSRGNYAEIETFLKSTDPAFRSTALQLLGLIADKDLRDTKAGILLDHLPNVVVTPAKAGTPSLTTNADLFNPRVANEMLVAYQKFLIYKFRQAFIDEMRQSPKNFINWIRQEIKIIPSENYYNTPLTPVGVYNLRVADEESRKIFAVACYRTFGIPSRLKPGTLEVEYWFRDRWYSADFGISATSPQPEATLILTSDPSNPVKPQYETHYTLARYEKGKYKTMAYGNDNSGDPLTSPLTLAQGHYLLVTGNRVPGGKVLSNLTFFKLTAGEKKEMMITLRKSGQATVVIGTLSPVWPVKPMDRNSFDWKQILATDRAIICWIEPDKEPSKHVFQDLGTLKKEIDKLDCPFIFLIPENKLPAGFTSDTWKNLPSSSRFVTIPDLSSLAELEKVAGKSLAGQFPIVIRINKDGKVTYLSSGYKIGIGEEIIKDLLMR